MAAITGEWLAAVNRAAQATGSIHDEKRARELGFAHAIVGAGMHIPLVTKAAVELFDKAWYERGFLKARFTSPVHEGQAIRVVLDETQPEASDERLLEMKIEKEDGEIVLSGYLGLQASTSQVVTPWQRDGESMAQSVDVYDPLPLDQIGDEFTPKTMVFEATESLPTVATVHDTCSWYEAASPWGGPILPTHRFVRLPRLSSDLHPDPQAAADMGSSINALFQVQHLGPVFCSQPYVAKAKLVGKGFSGRTAYRTSEASILDGDRCVSIVRQTLRWVPQRAMLSRS